MGGSADRPSRRSRGASVGVGVLLFLVALALRGAVLVELRHASPFVEYPGADGRFYDEWARTMLSTSDWVGGATFFQSPIYAYFLAAIYAVAGYDHLPVLAVQSVLGSLVPVLVLLITLRLAGTVRAGVVSGVLAAAYPVFLFSDTMMMKSVLLEVGTAGMLLALLVAADRPERRRRWVAAGVALGIAVLARETILLFVPVALGWAVVVAGRGGQSARRIAPALLGGVAVVILPIAVRNYLVTGELVLLTTGAGEVFFIGNNPQATGDYQVPGFVTPTSVKSREHLDFIAEAQRRTGRALSPAESSRFWMREGLGFLVAQPGRAAAVYARKLMVLINDFERPDDQCFYFTQRYSAVLRAIPLRFAVVFALGAVGVLAVRRRSPAWQLLTLFLAVYALSTLLFFVYSRFRLPMVVALLPFAGAAVERGARLAARRRFATLAAAGCAGMALYMVSLWPSFRGVPDEAILFYDAGIAYWGGGRLDEAREALEESLRRNPNFHLAHVAAAVVDAAQGRSDAALAHLDRAIAIDPAYAAAYEERAVLFARQGMTERALADVATLQDLQRRQAPVLSGAETTGEMARALASTQRRVGRALLAGGDPAEAADRFRAALRVTPESADIETDLGTALYRMGQPAEAGKRFAAALRLDPAHAEAHNNLGVLLADGGQLAEAEAHFRAALRARPAYASARFGLGTVRLRRGDAADAVAQFEAIVAVEPGNVAARFALGQALEAARRAEDAAAHYRDVLRRDPGNEPARAALARIEAAGR